LFVTADVIIKEMLKNLKMVEGEEAKFQCKVKNPKNYPIKWFKDGVEIEVPSDRSAFPDCLISKAIGFHMLVLM